MTTFIASRRQAQFLSRTSKGAINNARDIAAHTLNFYSEIPRYELSLDEFEEYALGRLKVLRKIEELRSRGLPKSKFDTELESTIKTNLVNQANGDLKELARIDQASHFILRSAYCRSEELRQWFLSQECQLFNYKLTILMKSGSSAATLQNILKKYHLSFEQVDHSEKEARREKLMACPLEWSDDGVSLADFSKTTYYKIPFLKALELVGKRSVYIEKGYAYVPTSRMVSILVQRFRTDVSRSLAHASANFEKISENSRIAPLLQSMNQQYTGKDYNAEGASGEELTTANIDDLAKQSMPLCMRQCHMGLRRTHHLKYQARLQYGRFLKSAGMSMEEQVMLMTREFTRLTSQEEFNKKYGYGIRHMYGKEGARKNYTGYNCSKIILGPLPQAGQFHGCPFRHSDKESLTSMLRSLRLDETTIKKIGHLQERKQYNLACQEHFLAAHPGVEDMKDVVSCNNVGNHPNAWYDNSKKYHEALKSSSSNTLNTKAEAKKVLPSVTPLKTEL